MLVIVCKSSIVHGNIDYSVYHISPFIGARSGSNCNTCFVNCNVNILVMSVSIGMVLFLVLGDVC